MFRRLPAVGRQLQSAMGWSCNNCGDVNPSDSDVCDECGTKEGAAAPFRLHAQPLGASVLWLATLFGGVLSGYLIAIWNGRVLRRHNPLTTVGYAAVAVVGWLATLWCIANLEPAHEVISPILLPEPGFAIPVALALGFLLVAIPYNRDTLAVNQWTWDHPGRKLVLTIGSRGVKLGYVSFSGIEGSLMGSRAAAKPWLAIPVLPVVVLALSLALGVLTLVIGSALAPGFHHHH